MIQVSQSTVFNAIIGTNLDYKILVTDALTGLRSLASESVHCVVTSIPYWGLRVYDVEPITFSDGWHGHLGLELTIDLFVAHIVEIFNEIKRVLRYDGTCWVNIGDCYGQQGRRSDPGDVEKNQIRAIKRNYPTAAFAGTNKGWDRAANTVGGNIKQKDLCGQPWACAFALRASGWYLRSEIVWHKTNVLPESVRDRPSKAHETIFLLAKLPVYYYDRIRVQEPIKQTTIQRSSRAVGNHKTVGGAPGQKPHSFSQPRDRVSDVIMLTRNRRTVWNISNKPYHGAHFATFPLEIPQLAILAGTSEKGCCNVCLAPWKRVLEPASDYKEHLGKSFHSHENDLLHGMGQKKHKKFQSIIADYKTIDWVPTCKCARNDKPLAKPVVLDPFVGSGTTIIAALQEGCIAIGIELSSNYAAMAKERIETEVFKPRKKVKNSKSSKLARSLQISLFEIE